MSLKGSSFPFRTPHASSNTFMMVFNLKKEGKNLINVECLCDRHRVWTNVKSVSHTHKKKLHSAIFSSPEQCFGSVYSSKDILSPSHAPQSESGMGQWPWSEAYCV